MSRENDLASPRLNNIPHFLDQKVNCSRVEAVLDFFNNNERWWFWMAEHSQKARDSQRAGGKQPCRNGKTSLLHFEHNFLFPIAIDFNRAQVTGKWQYNLHGFDKRIVSVCVQLAELAQ